MENGAKNSIKKLLSVLDEYITMQKDHALGLRGDKLSALPDWLERRQNVSSRLQQCLGQFDPDTLPAESRIARQVRRKMDELMQYERDLTALVDQQRNTIQGKICTIRKGKGILRGYSLSGTSPRPKFLSSRT